MVILAQDHSICCAPFRLLAPLLLALVAAVEEDLASHENNKQEHKSASHQVDDHVDCVKVMDVVAHEFFQRLATTLQRVTIVYVAVNENLKWIFVVDSVADA